LTARALDESGLRVGRLVAVAATAAAVRRVNRLVMIMMVSKTLKN
jgi:hypothetical protein